MNTARTCISQTLSLLLLFVLLLPMYSSAQGLDVSIGEVNFSGLPRVTFKACVRVDGQIVRGVDPSNMMLLENGELVPVTIRCPDPTEINSVVLVLDNSGSMQAAMPKLIEASKRLVDSLGPNDEAAIITLGDAVVLVEDFTTDKDVLKAALDQLVAQGGTRLFSATYRACAELETRSGNRHAVVITDGADTGSNHTVIDAIDYANAIEAKIHTIAFDIEGSARDLMEQMAVETGGIFFFVSRPGELTSVYETIADIITEPCCIAEYVSQSCKDSVRSLLLTVQHNGETADDVQTVISPVRALQTTLSVEVPEDLTPLATGRGYVDITPPPSTELALTMSFTLHYDPNLVQISLLPFTLATVTQDQVVEMSRIGPGRLRVSLTEIKPPFASTRLFGFPIEALQADSSRKVPFSISDIVIEGCPTEFTTVPDSTLICQCYRALDIEMDTLPLFAADQSVVLPVRVRGGLEMSLPLVADLSLQLPSEIQDVDVLPGNLFPAEALSWTREGDELRMAIEERVLPTDTSGVLAYLRFGPNEEQGIRRINLSLLESELWQRCCPLDGEPAGTFVVQDGNCDFVLKLRQPEVEVQNAPNPFSASNCASTDIVLRIPSAFADRHATLDVLDGQGRLLRRLFDGTLTEGEHRQRFDAGELPAGVYHAVLRSGDLVVSRAMLYVR